MKGVWVCMLQVWVGFALYGQTDSAYMQNVLPGQVHIDRAVVQYLKTDHISEAVDLFDTTLAYNLRPVITDQLSEIASMLKLHSTFHKDSTLTYKTFTGLHVYKTTYTFYIDQQPSYSFSFYFSNKGDVTRIKYATTRRYTVIPGGSKNKPPKQRLPHETVTPPPSLGGM